MMPNSLVVLLPFDEEALEQTMKGGSSLSFLLSFITSRKYGKQYVDNGCPDGASGMAGGNVSQLMDGGMGDMSIIQPLF